MQFRKPIALLALTVAFSAIGCDSCQSKPEEPKVVAPPAPDVSVEEEPVDPLKEARENAEDEAENVAVVLNDSARNVAASMEALANRPKAPARPKAPKEEPETGKIDTAAVKRVFNQNNGAMRKCYERVLKKKPGIEGKVRLVVKIRGDGSVASASANGSLNERSIFDCMERQAKTMKFPKPNGGAVRVANPYTFTPEF